MVSRRDLEALRRFGRGMVWLVRANATLVAIAALSILLAPVQLTRWLRGPESFARTAPSLWLRYLFAKGTAFPGERPISRLSYEAWKRRYIPQ